MKVPFMLMVTLVLIQSKNGEAVCGVTYQTNCVTGLRTLKPEYAGRVQTVAGPIDCSNFCTKHRNECVAFDITDHLNGQYTCQLIKSRQYTKCNNIPNTKHYILVGFAIISYFIVKYSVFMDGCGGWELEGTQPPDGKTGGALQCCNSPQCHCYIIYYFGFLH